MNDGLLVIVAEIGGVIGRYVSDSSCSAAADLASASAAL